MYLVGRTETLQGKYPADSMLSLVSQLSVKAKMSEMSSYARAHARSCGPPDCRKSLHSFASLTAARPGGLLGLLIGPVLLSFKAVLSLHCGEDDDYDDDPVRPSWSTDVQIFIHLADHIFLLHIRSISGVSSVPESAICRDALAISF